MKELFYDDLRVEQNGKPIDPYHAVKIGIRNIVTGRLIVDSFECFSKRIGAGTDGAGIYFPGEIEDEEPFEGVRFELWKPSDDKPYAVQTITEDELLCLMVLTVDYYCKLNPSHAEEYKTALYKLAKTWDKIPLLESKLAELEKAETEQSN